MLMMSESVGAVISYAFNAWVCSLSLLFLPPSPSRLADTARLARTQFQIAFFPASASPAFTRGSSLIIAFCPLLALFTMGVRGLQVRTERRRARDREGVVEEEVEEKGGEMGEGKRPGTGTTVVGEVEREGEEDGKEVER